MAIEDVEIRQRGGVRVEMHPIYSKDYKVDVALVDFRKNVKLSALFLLFQDVAVLHASSLGLGMQDMQNKHNALWVLARMRLDVERYPSWGQGISLETWPNEPGRVEFTRNFLVKDAHGKILVRAISNWAIIDLSTRRLKKVDSVFPQELPFPQEKAIDTKLGRLRASGELSLVHKRVVGYSDIDVNGHLNNAKYVDFVTDCFSLEEHKKHEIKSIEINYSSEALPGDTIGLYKDTSQLDQGIVYVEGSNKADGTLIFKAKMRI
jgi:medium-chain acyl-[acyl-carrier-protein] hydrolase